MDTTHRRSFTTPPAELDFASKRRADFARQAVRLEFRARDARALDQGDFRDRKPHEAPRPAPWWRATNSRRRVEEARAREANLSDFIGAAA